MERTETIPERHSRHERRSGEARCSSQIEGRAQFEQRARHGGRRGHGGPRVGRGDLRAAVLLLLDEKPTHGYQIIQEIEDRTGGIWRPSPGSVYPALQVLQDEGFVGVEEKEGRRVFHLTDTGRAYVEERRDWLAAARDAVTETVHEGVVEMHDLVQQLKVAVKQVMHAGTPAQISAASAVLVDTRRQLYRILAGDEPTSEQKPLLSQE